MGMQPIGTMIRRTTHHVGQAGTTARRELAGAVAQEANVWGTYVRQGAGSLMPSSLERTFLTKASLTLRALDARLRRRLEALNGSGRTRKSPPRAAKKNHARSN